MSNQELNEAEMNLDDIMGENMTANDAMAEMAEMLKALEAEVGKEEINRRLEETMKQLAEMNPHGIEAKLLRIQKGELKDLLLPEKYADYTAAH